MSAVVRLERELNAVGDGATGAVFIAVRAVGKRDSQKFPHVVTNEIVCSRLASALALPCPPGCLTTSATRGDLLFASMDFNLAGENLPPARAANVLAQHPIDSVGIVLFDAWVMNYDRHSRNLALDSVSGRLSMFDHSHALTNNVSRPLDWIDAQVGTLRIADDGGHVHCLAQGLCSMAHIETWIQRIESVPEFYIRRVLKDVSEVSLAPGEADEIADRLLLRRAELPRLLLEERGHFPKVPESEWSKFATARHLPYTSPPP